MVLLSEKVDWKQMGAEDEVWTYGENSGLPEEYR
jgi:hypothetical protein